MTTQTGAPRPIRTKLQLHRLLDQLRAGPGQRPTPFSISLIGVAAKLCCSGSKQPQHLLNVFQTWPNCAFTLWFHPSHE